MNCAHHGFEPLESCSHCLLARVKELEAFESKVKHYFDTRKYVEGTYDYFSDLPPQDQHMSQFLPIHRFDCESNGCRTMRKNSYKNACCGCTCELLDILKYFDYKVD